ncbi:MAG TPA: Lrp/AsnC ligand binding domain-containing protein [Nitrososphaera sp.]|nr:Lrp/AsnC ligand binding domain-containing protein [Nitrososphaera sp.]
MAFVFVNCAFDQNSSVEKAVREIDGVLEAHSTTGIYDLILKVQAKDEMKFQELIRKIKSISGVTSTLTSIAYSGSSKTKVVAE